MDSRRKTEEKVFSYIEEHNMIAPGSKIMAGVSGGADSVCLLFLLLEYAKRMPVELAVIHVNHGLREDAEQDAEFVRMLCRQEEVPFFLREVDVRKLAAREKRTLEEAGRILRYQVFQEEADSFGADSIAVAHNGNDCAETMLFHLFRGSGVKGLSGIPPVRDNIIRPLLCLERSEIERYLNERGIPYRTDATNEEDDYTRNRIRHHILPMAEQKVSAAAVPHMLHTARMLSELEDYLELQVREARLCCVVRGQCGDGEPAGGGQGSGQVDRRGGRKGHQSPASVVLTVDVECFRRLHIAIKKRLLLGLLRELAPGGRDISAVHVEEVLALFEKSGNPHIDLPFGIQADRRYGKVLLVRREETGRVNLQLPQEGLQFQEVELLQEIEMPSGEAPEAQVFDMGICGHAEISVFFVKSGQKIPMNEYTKWFDCDKIIKPPVFRFRETGDYLTLSNGKGGLIHKSLKDYMITEKIPRENRDWLPVLAEGSHVLWLMGYRISEYYKVNENTKRVLQVKLLGNCPDSGMEEKDGGNY